MQGVFPGSIREHFLQHVLINERKKASERWIYVWIGVVWSLWKARSNIILRGSNFDKQKLIQEAHAISYLDTVKKLGYRVTLFM